MVTLWVRHSKWIFLWLIFCNYCINNPISYGGISMDTKQLKETVRKWISDIDKTEKIPANIIALSFNLYEPYGIELVGSERYDDEDEDWACEEDFVPRQRICPGFNISREFKWEEVLEVVTVILKELLAEMPDSQVFGIKHIATGFVDGNLVTIK